MTRRHAAVLARGDSTDMAEFKMGMGMLLHRRLAAILPGGRRLNGQRVDSRGALGRRRIDRPPSPRDKQRGNDRELEEMQLADFRRIPRLFRRFKDIVEPVYDDPRHDACCRCRAAAPTPPSEPALDRNAKILYGLNRGGLGLEIGPSFSPIARKADGFSVEVIDHATAAELRQKYRGHPNVDISRIEEVDYVWRGEPLDELLGTARYDWIIASHVIEHIPDLLAFFQQCTRLLRPDGVLSLVIPDKRYCFDYFRWPSTTGDLLQANADGRRRHPAGVVFDHVAQIVKRDGEVSWSAQARGDFTFIHALDEAKAAFESARRSEEYVDVHCWRFTPASFRLILAELRLVGLLALEEVSSFPTLGCEFFLTLKPTTAMPANIDRMALYHQVARELLEGLQEKKYGKFLG